MTGNVATQDRRERITLAHEADFVAGRLTIRPSAREVVSGEQTTTLEPRVMQVLVAPARAKPRGMVSFMEGEKTLAIVPLNANGTATLAVSTLPVGAHALIAAYAGDRTFGHSLSGRFNAEIGRR